MVYKQTQTPLRKFISSLNLLTIDILGDEFPGPSEYHTELDMVWHNRGFPMIGKGKPERYETCSLGPAAYMVTYGNFGAGRSKQAIGTRPKIIHGPPDTMVQPVDTFRKFSIFFRMSTFCCFCEAVASPSTSTEAIVRRP